MIPQLSPETIETRILILRGLPVMLDSDVAELYEVTTRHLNQQVKRNRRRFPADFMFRLTPEESATVGRPLGRRIGFRPYAFTEQGAGMLASVLRGPIAGRVAVEILRAFKRLRPDEELPGPSNDAVRVVGGLFAAIRDAAHLAPGDAVFTTDDAYTYFVRAGDEGPIKIGWTRNLLVRLRTLSVMWPVPLKLLGVIKGNVEAQCHARFADFRLGGEWFMPAPSVQEFIRENALTPDSIRHARDGKEPD